MTKEEFQKMKQELEALVQIKFPPNLKVDTFIFSEYLAMFKKTVNMHEVFLQRLGNHPTLRNDPNFRVFLEYPQDVEFKF